MSLTMSPGLSQRLCCLLIILGAAACVTSSETETVSFERAEASYREGTYRQALEGYEAFLQAYPQSPLAEIAKLRIRCISREVRAMRGPSDRPRPIYRAAGQDATRK